MSNGPANVSFREVQYLRQWWIFLLVLIDLFVVFQLVGIREPEGRLLIAGTIVFIGLIVGILLGSHFVTEVRDDGIYIRYFPFHRTFRRIPYADIASFEARTYSPIGEYGGWGIRGMGKNRAYNVSGNRGVQLVLKDGKRLLIGSQRADDLAQAIDTAKRNAG